MAIRCDPYWDLRNPVLFADSDVAFTAVYSEFD